MANERWRYQVIELKPKWVNVSKENFEEALNKAGQIGWELVSVVRTGTAVQCFMKQQR